MASSPGSERKSKRTRGGPELYLAGTVPKPGPRVGNNSEQVSVMVTHRAR